MNTSQETSIAIDFSRGQDIDVTVVFDGVEMENKTFNISNHQIEEVMEFIQYNRNGGCDVFI
jgi:hypothetical protein